MLPNRESVFDLDYTADSGKKYDGQFTVRTILTVGQKHQLELEKTRLLGNHISPTDDLIALAILLSNLRTRITSAPSWWEQSQGGYTIEDEDVLLEIYKKIRDTEEEWKNKLKAKAEEALKKEAPEAASESSNP